MNTFKAQILTPDGPVYNGDLTGAVLPGVQGSFEVLYNHADLMTTLEVGIARIKSADNAEVKIAISGGFAEVKSNQLIVLAEAAETIDQIDVDRAKSARERALKRMKEKNVDRLRAEAALMRAVNRLRLAGVLY